jgi:hypothetical protein
MLKQVEVLVSVTLEGNRIDAAKFLNKTIKKALKKGKGKKLKIENRDVHIMLRTKEGLDDWWSYKNIQATGLE